MKNDKQPSVVVSVIMPVYNVSRYLRHCMDSVLAQTFTDFEVICVDDGSTDDSVKILNEYRDGDVRIKVVLQENQGAGVARNKALDMARGKWIAFMDPDDCYPSHDVLHHLVSAAEANSVNICGGSLCAINTEGEKMDRQYSGDNSGYVFDADALREYNDYQFEYGYWRFIYRRSLLEDNKLRFPEVRRFQDPPFMVSAFSCAGKFYALKEPTYCYREGEGFKNVDWKADDFLKARHFLRGLRTVLSNARKNGYRALFERTLRRMFNGGGKFLWTDEYFPHLTADINPILDEFLPKVSIVIPVYNVRDFVAETLDSVLAQQYPNLEVVCVNDGSTDDSLSVVERYIGKFSGVRKLLIHSQENGGLSAARNSGMDLATGKYIYFLDSDDKIIPSAISELVTLAEANELDQIIFSSDVFVDGDDPALVKQAENFKKYYSLPQDLCNMTLSGGEMLDELTARSKFHCSQPLRFYRRQPLEEGHCRFPVGLLHEDNFFAPLSMRFAKKVMILNRRLYMRRVRGNSIMTSNVDYSPRLHGVFGICLRLLDDDQLWNGDEKYVAGLRRHVQTLSRAIGWNCRSVPSDKWEAAVADLYRGGIRNFGRFCIEFLLPLLNDRAAEIVCANNNVKLCGSQKVEIEALKKTCEDSKAGFSALEKSCKALDAEVQALKNSESYKVGMLLTLPFRKVFHLIRH